MSFNQIKNLIEDIENTEDENDFYLKHMELVKLILENLPQCNENMIQKMRDEELLSDVFYEIKESSQVLIQFIEKNIEFIESDFKGSDFETEVKEHTSNLKTLNDAFDEKSQAYEEIKKLEREAKEVRLSIQSLEDKISEFDGIDMEKLLLEKEKLESIFKEFKETKGEMLQKHKKHFEINNDINIFSKQIEELSKEINAKIKELEGEYKKVLSMENDI